MRHNFVYGPVELQYNSLVSDHPWSKTKWSHTGGGRYQRVDCTPSPECQGPALLAAPGIAVWGDTPAGTSRSQPHSTTCFAFLREGETARSLRYLETGRWITSGLVGAFFGFHHPASKPHPHPNATRLRSHLPPIHV